jgi:nuclear pore complex protein Nup62
LKMIKGSREYFQMVKWLHQAKYIGNFQNKYGPYQWLHTMLKLVMYVYLYVCVLICICACVCIYEYVCIYWCVWIYVYVYMCEYVDVYWCLCICWYVCVFACVHVCACVLMSEHAWTWCACRGHRPSQLLVLPFYLVWVGASCFLLLHMPS